MIKEYRIFEDDGKGSYKIFETPDFEFSNTVEYYKEVFMRTQIFLERELLLSKIPREIFPDLDGILYRRALKSWDEKYEAIIKTEVPDNFISLLKSESKGEQVKLLKNASIIPEQLIAFIVRAWNEFGFSFSQYTAHHHRKGIDETALPKVINVKGEKVESIGETTLSGGQLKQVVEQRKVIVSKFLDNGSNWHCLFLTFRSLRSEENWNDGQPHFHYLSDKFGIDRDKVVGELKSKEYRLGNLPHIKLLDYRQEKITKKL